jgi:hypothetical protein
MEKNIENAIYWKRMAEINPDIMSFSAEEFGVTDVEIEEAEKNLAIEKRRGEDITLPYIPEEPEEPVSRKKKSKRKTRREIREAVISRDKCCTVCGKTSGLEVHHVIYRSKGGTDDMGNLVTLCKSCHAEKHKGEPIHRLMVKSVTSST